MSAVPLPVHPAAELFPLMSAAELRELAEDIRQHGLHVPITMHRGRVLDGRNRLRACDLAGVKPRFDEYSGAEPVAYAVAQNLRRRHLSDDQRAQIAAEALPMFEAEARRKQGHGKTAPGKTLEADRPQAKRAPQARDQAGAAFGVSGRQVQRAKRVAEADPGLADQVKRGAVPLAAAEREVARRDESDIVAQLDHLDPDGAERARQAALIFEWSRIHARLGKVVTELLALPLEDLAATFSDLNRVNARTGIDLFHNYCDRMEHALTASSELRLLEG